MGLCTIFCPQKQGRFQSIPLVCIWEKVPWRVNSNNTSPRGKCLMKKVEFENLMRLFINIFHRKTTHHGTSHQLKMLWKLNKFQFIWKIRVIFLFNLSRIFLIPVVSRPLLALRLREYWFRISLYVIDRNRPLAPILRQRWCSLMYDVYLTCIDGDA